MVGQPKDAEGNNIFEGGFLGLDNIGPVDRSMLPAGGRLEQSDGTAWMAMYCLNLLEIALVLAEHDAAYEDLATKFLEHFAYIATAINVQGLWNEEDGSTTTSSRSLAASASPCGSAPWSA